MAKNFEYKIVAIKYEYDAIDQFQGDAEARLNDCGAEGWELVSSIVMQSPKTASAYSQIWYFKREFSGQPTEPMIAAGQASSTSQGAT